MDLKNLSNTQVQHLKDVLEVNLDDIADGIWDTQGRPKNELTADVKDVLEKLEGNA